jgi:hypothetical protein
MKSVSRPFDAAAAALGMSFGKAEGRESGLPGTGPRPSPGNG